MQESKMSAVLATMDFALVIDEDGTALESHAKVNPQLKDRLIKNGSWEMLNDEISKRCKDIEYVLSVALSV